MLDMMKKVSEQTVHHNFTDQPQDNAFCHTSQGWDITEFFEEHDKEFKILIRPSNSDQAPVRCAVKLIGQTQGP